MTWPDEVDILTADDVCKGGFDGPNKSHCALGWIRRWFDALGGVREHPHEARTMENTLRRVADYAGRTSAWNDNPLTVESDIAAALNETNRRLGYDVPRKACGRFYDPKAKVMG